jgi:predicted GIY-YIG superfamily endonuclease
MLTSLYRFYDAAGALLYIGITNSIPRRLGEHDERKPWFANSVRATFEHHPSRAAALTAEKKAIKAERPKYNIVHNHGREVVQAKPAKGGQWVFRSRESNWEKQANLFLYPELECSSMVDNVHYLDSEGQFEEYVQYLERRYPEWLDADAVPIIWSVRSRESVDSIYETAPFQPFAPGWGDFLTHFTWPVDIKTGERLDWFRLPVVNERFPEFAEALAWTPSPLQPTCPLRSILRSRAGQYAAPAA